MAKLRIKVLRRWRGNLLLPGSSIHSLIRGPTLIANLRMQCDPATPGEQLGLEFQPAQS